jgi:transposase
VPRLYPREFRDDVVRVARDRDGGVTIEQIAGDFGVHPQTITPWDGNEGMAREVSPWTPRCADPWCQSRRARHRR